MKDLSFQVIKLKRLSSSFNPPLSIQDLSLTPSFSVGSQRLQCYNFPHLTALSREQKTWETFQEQL